MRVPLNLTCHSTRVSLSTQTIPHNRNGEYPEYPFRVFLALNVSLQYIWQLQKYPFSRPFLIPLYLLSIISMLDDCTIENCGALFVSIKLKVPLGDIKGK